MKIDKNNISYLFSILFILCFSYIKTYIVLPFKEIQRDEAYNFKDVDELLNEILYLNLYSDFYLGSSPHKLIVILKPNIDYFAIKKNDEEQSISSDNYNPSSSDSLKLVASEDKIYLNKEGFSLMSETFHFLMSEEDLSSIYSDESRGKIDANNYYSFTNINFLKSDSEKIKNYCGILGFSYPNVKNESFNFIKELHRKSLIESAVWSIDFPDIDEDTFKKGNIIIGEFPHIYDSKYYKEDQFFKTKMPKRDNNDNSKDWEITIDSASIIKRYYENTHKKEIGTAMPYIKTISITFGAYLMHAPKELFEQLKDLYFNNLFDSGICDYKKIKTDDDKIMVVFCNKKLFDKNEQMNFPSLYFDVQELGGIFELNHKDVFVTKNDKVFLLISFSSKKIENTIKLGQNFLYKYKFTFDYAKNEIGFYRTNLESQKIVHRIKRAFRGRSLLLFFVFIFITCTLYICYKKGYLLKKRLIDYSTANKNISYFTGENIEQGYELKNDN